MATNTTPIFLKSVISKTAAIVTAGGTAEVDMVDPGADGGAVVNLTASTDDTSDVIVVINIDDGVVSVPLGEVTVPAGAGTDGTVPSKNLLDSTKMPGAFQADGSVLLGPSAKLTVNPKAAVTAAKTLYVTAAGGSYSA